MSYAELMGFKKTFGFYDGAQGMPCNLNIITLPEATVTIALGAQSFTAQADSLGIARFEVQTAGLWSVTAVKDNITQVGTVKIENVVTTALNLPRSLEDFTWSEISAISKAGIASQNFNIGDTKNITLSSGEVIIAQIIGFDHDDVADGSLATYGRNKAGITFQAQNVMDTPYRMSASFIKWEGTEMRLTTLPTIKGTMPSDLTSYIIPVKKYTSNSSSTTAGAWAIETTIDELFLLSRAESVNTNIQHAGEGLQYEYYSEGRSAIKTNNSSTARIWWNRSPIYSSASGAQYSVVTTTGGVSSYVLTSNYYIAPAFCI